VETGAVAAFDELLGAVFFAEAADLVAPLAAFPLFPDADPFTFEPAFVFLTAAFAGPAAFFGLDLLLDFAILRISLCWFVHYCKLE
jgi:hypothetical protein